MRFKMISAAALLVSVAATPAVAQEVGATVMGNDDAPVGTVISNDGTTVLVDTGAHQVPLGTDMFAEAEGVYTINATKTAIDTMMADMKAQQAAALQAALVVGAPVVSADAHSLGMIKTIEAENIVLEGDPAMTLPKNLFALSPEGMVMVLAEHATLMEALEAAQGG